MAPNSRSVPATVMVVGGDVIVGHALELLLRSNNYEVRFLHEPSLEDGGPLEKAQLLLLTPDLEVQRREELLIHVRNSPVTRDIPVLELVNVLGGKRAKSNRYLSWPCRADSLKRRIDAELVRSDSPDEVS